MHELLTEKESIIISTLEKMHLIPTDICIPSGGGYIRLDAVSINGKFKFIKDQGCNSNGQNKNHQTLYNKSEKMANKLNDAVGLKFRVNPFSLEENEKLGNKNSVLIQIYI